MAEQQDPEQFEPNPVGEEDDPDEVLEDPDMGDMPDDLAPGSYDADPDDHLGEHDHPR